MRPGTPGLCYTYEIGNKNAALHESPLTQPTRARAPLYLAVCVHERVACLQHPRKLLPGCGANKSCRMNGSVRREAGEPEELKVVEKREGESRGSSAGLRAGLRAGVLLGRHGWLNKQS